MKLSRFLKPAEEEMNEAALYYNCCANGLGLDFINKVRSAISAIEENPDLCPVITNSLRRCLIRRFPYAIFYANNPDEIVIIAVAHLKRRPFYWLDRK